MRESIGGGWLFTLMIVFILLFTAFLAVTINYSRAFKIKNAVIDIIEEEEGFTNDSTSNDPGAMQRINNYLTGVGYTNKGTCAGDNWLVEDGEKADSGTKYRYCIKKHNKYSDTNPQKAYYEVTIFFSLNLPVFGDFLTFRVNGETTDIFYPADCTAFGEC